MRRWGFDILRARTIVFRAKNIGVCFPHLCPFFVLGIHGMHVVGLDFGILIVWVVRRRDLGCGGERMRG